MTDIRVTSADTLEFYGKTYRCAIGKGGFELGERKEGSGTTPTGRFALRECWYRLDRIAAPAIPLTLRHITPADGWCDAADHEQYNRPVKLPFAASHEQLFRQDHAYDIVIPLGYNDAPVIPGLGSAIFFHLAQPDYRPTEGCVAVAMDDMLEILSRLNAQTHMLITG